MDCAECHLDMGEFLCFGHQLESLGNEASQHEATRQDVLSLGQDSSPDHIDNSKLVGRRCESRQAGGGQNQRLCWLPLPFMKVALMKVALGQALSATAMHS